MRVLQDYYLIPYAPEKDFYEQFYSRGSQGEGGNELN